ncbi:galactose-1-epimerase [Prevotella denticola]|uniref:galactose-1-epimerase n=1 Tax=Prevotella denticola TaxID=28129 RepID=UPI001C5DCDE1|nr:galactose-1-epimerase [Prevotella denticola]MBW4897658.1 galactose-1-epimerase [Prevotella denticola]
MKRKISFALFSMLMAGATASAQTAYTNPVIDSSAPDPSVIRADDGTFYLYATENIRNTPIFHSADLVHWNLVGTAFTDETRPGWLPDGGIWAPDINKIGDDYVMYYSKSVWGGIWDAGIGVAVSRKPEGPFVDKGNIIQSRAIGVCNSIDPFYIEDQGRKYLFWGSFRGIFGAELTADGLRLKADAQPVQIAGTFMEATCIHRHGGYYYLFGSAGTCCEGNKSTYHITVGRSKNLFGPYVDKDGRPLMENHYETVLAGNADVAGPGHNAEIVTDDEGRDYILYHGVRKADDNSYRLVYMDRIDWQDGWPHILDKAPARVEEKPRLHTGWGMTRSGLNPSDFEMNIAGKQTHLYTLTNKKGMEVCLTNFGARIVSLMAPDREGRLHDVVLGYDNIAEYSDYKHFGSDFGASIGRYANRINQGRFKTGNETIQLPRNNYGHCLHGGFTGWQYKVYDGKKLNGHTIQFRLVSPDKDNSFPGTVEATVTYTLTDDNAIDIRYTATTDKETVINMTNHSYFNLNGKPMADGEDQVLYINADSYTPSDTTYMTTGEILPVKGTPMDFRHPTPLSKDINNQLFDMTKNAMGFDHNWCLNTYKHGKGNDKAVAASLYSPQTGIRLEVFTDEPGLQVYTGNFLDGSFAGKHGYRYPRHASVCLETQHYPDSPNKPQWPSPYLKPGEVYHSHCVYKFSAK